MARASRARVRHPHRLVRWLAALVVVGFVLLNALAFTHARSLTRFTHGARTKPPSRLSRLEKLSVLVRGARLGHSKNDVSPVSLGLPFERHLFAGRERRVLEAWHIPHEHPRGIVMGFHGHGGCKADLLREARVFRTLGFGVLLVDFPGAGGSEGDTTSIGFHEAEDVGHATAYARTLPGGHRLIAYGVSMGAAAVLRAAALHASGPDALIVEAPFDRLRTTVAHRFEAMGLPAFPAADLLVFWGGVQQGFSGFAHDPRVYAARVEQPLLLIHGDRDPYVTPTEAMSIVAAARGPADSLTCPGVGHASCLRARPWLWREAVERFLASDPTRARRPARALWSETPGAAAR
jgi:uncharacterized protein